jgi:hypothetical protein
MWNQLTLVHLGVSPIGGLVTLERTIFDVLRDNHLGNLVSRLTPALNAFAATLANIVENPFIIIHRNGTVAILDDLPDLRWTPGLLPPTVYPWVSLHP